MATKNQQINEFDINGKVLFVGPPEEYQSQAGNKRSFRIIVIETFIGRYSNPCAFEFNLSNMSQLSDIKVGDWVNITFSLSGYSTKKDGRVRYFSKNTGLACIKS